MEVRACFRVPRRSQFRHDSSNYVLVAENAPVSEQGEPLGLRVEHHPPAWKFLILELRRHSAFLLESCPHGNVIARVNLEVVVLFTFAQGSTVNEQLAVD